MSATFSNIPAKLPNSSASRTDPNALNLADYKGEIQICPFCKPLDRLSGRSCSWCMSRGYVAVCLNCDGVGLHTSKSVWDGKSEHSSTCNMCGGKGLFPANEKDFLAGGGKLPSESTVEDANESVLPVAKSPLPIPETITAMKNVQITRPKKG